MARVDHISFAGDTRKSDRFSGLARIQTALRMMPESPRWPLVLVFFQIVMVLAAFNVGLWLNTTTKQRIDNPTREQELEAYMGMNQTERLEFIRRITKERTSHLPME